MPDRIASAARQAQNGSFPSLRLDGRAAADPVLSVANGDGVRIEQCLPLGIRLHVDGKGAPTPQSAPVAGILPEIVEVMTVALDLGSFVRAVENRCEGRAVALELRSTEVPQCPGRLAGGPVKCPFAFYIFKPKIGIIVGSIQSWTEIERGHVRTT